MFVVAKITFFDYELEQKIKQYESLEDAYFQEAMVVDNVIDEDDDSKFSIDEIKQRYFDCDMMINILEVPK